MTKNAESQIFRYGFDGLMNEYFGLVAGVVMFGSATVLVWVLSERGAFSDDPTLLYFICGPSFVYFVVLTSRAYRFVRPISVSPDGVRALYHFSSALLIEWPRISRIEQHRETMPFGTPRVFFYIYGDGKKIRFDDYMEDLDDLVSILNEYIRQYRIRIISIDRSPDALNSATDVRDRWKLLRDGVLTEPDHLTTPEPEDDPLDLI